MSYRGTGAPQIRQRLIDGTINQHQMITLPRPIRGGRSENWINKTEVYENIDGELIAGVPKFRFEAEYEFGLVYGNSGDSTDVEGGLIDTLSGFYNDGISFNLVPHVDIMFVNYDVVVEELEIPKLDGIVFNNTLKVKFKGIKYVQAIPTIDNMLGCVFFWRVFGIDESYSGE